MHVAIQCLDGQLWVVITLLRDNFFGILLHIASRIPFLYTCMLCKFGVNRFISADWIWVRLKVRFLQSNFLLFNSILYMYEICDVEICLLTLDWSCYVMWFDPGLVGWVSHVLASVSVGWCKVANVAAHCPPQGLRLHANPELSGSACLFANHPVPTEVMFVHLLIFALLNLSVVSEILLSGSRSLMRFIWSFYRASLAQPRSVLATLSWSNVWALVHMETAVSRLH